LAGDQGAAGEDAAICRIPGRTLAEAAALDRALAASFKSGPGLPHWSASWRSVSRSLSICLMTRALCSRSFCSRRLSASGIHPGAAGSALYTCSP
jgi:hypothetical protein